MDGAIERQLHADGGCQLSGFALGLALRRPALMRNLVTGAMWARKIPRHNLTQFGPTLRKGFGEERRRFQMARPRLSLDKHKKAIRLVDAHTLSLRSAERSMGIALRTIPSGLKESDLLHEHTLSVIHT
jgi:predicted DNA-binding protein (UPF0251 family)